VLDPVQFSATSHTPADARHTVVEGAKASAGQSALDPVQFSTSSQIPADVRHTVPDATNMSAGHAALEPVQLSATSHTPADARQTVPDDANMFAGQAALDPVQFSAVSHTSADGRHTVADDANMFAEQAALDPVQFSAVSQMPADARHTVAVDAKASAGQSALDPVQFSATSHTPADARHTVADDANAFAGQVALDPVHVSATSQTPVEGRQLVPAATNLQFERQHDVEVPLAAPSSQSSLGLSTIESPHGSMKVVCAISPEVSPVAVSVKTTPTSASWTTNASLKMSPFPSAVAESTTFGCVIGTSSSSSETVSKGCQPEPVMITVSPGWYPDLSVATVAARASVPSATPSTARSPTTHVVSRRATGPRAASDMS
jgi:hypothetical protein